MKYALSLLLCAWVSCPIIAQISVTATAVESRCSANGQIILTTTGGASPYTYEIIASPSGFTRPPQVNDTFRQLPPGDYTILITDNNSRTVRKSVTVQGNYREPTLDSVQIEGSTARIFASGGRPKLRYTYSNNSGRNFAPYQDSSVFYCLPNADYVFRVYDSCDNFYTAYKRIYVPDVNFYALCENQADGSTNIRNIYFNGGEPPYLFTCINNFGDTITNTTGTFNGLSACNFRVILTDKCQRRTERFYDCPPANLVLYVKCASFSHGTATVLATGGTPPYRFQETRSGRTSTNGVFDSLKTNGQDFYFVVTDACGRSNQTYVSRMSLVEAAWRGCPFDSSVRLRVYQYHREPDTCGRDCSQFLPFKFNCVDCSPPSVLTDSGQYRALTNQQAAYFPKVGAGIHNFEVSNGCGDTLRFDVKMDTVELSVWASVSCADGTIQAYSSVGDTKFYLLDTAGVTLDSNAIGTFTAPYFGTFTIEGRHKGCRSGKTTVAAFLNPYVRVGYTSCDSIAVYTCPVISGWRFLLRDSNRRIVDSNTTGRFTNLLNGAFYAVLATHPNFRDTVATTATTSSLPPFYARDITCSSLCISSYYGWEDQHRSPLTFILQDSLTGATLAQNQTGCFYNLNANTPYKVTIKHPYCGTQIVFTKTAPSAKPTFCLAPTSKIRNGKCIFAWNLYGSAASTKLKLVGGPDSVNTESAGPNAWFYELSSGKYILSTDCTFDTIQLPKVQMNLKARSGPSCPNIASIQAYGGRKSSDWRIYGDSIGVNICNAPDDVYNLYDERGIYLTSNYDGFFNYLIPGKLYEIRLSIRNCELDSVKLNTTFYERTDLVTSYGAICDTLGRDRGKIRATLNGGTAPYTFEILAPAGIRAPIQTNSGSVLFDNLPAGSYTLRAYDACGISADYTGSIGVLRFTPQYKRLCNGWLELEVPEIDGAKYKWSLPNNPSVIDTTRTIRIQDTASKTLVVSVRTDDSCFFETRITVPSFGGSLVRSFAGNDTIGFNKNFTLNADSLKRSLSGRWSQIAPSSAGTAFLQANNPKTNINVNQLPGLYTYVWSVYDSLGGCYTTDTVQVTFCNPTIPLDVQIIATPSRCTIPTGTIMLNVLNATTPLSYQWSNNKQSSSLDSLNSGIYTVTINDQSVCTTPLIKEITIIEPKIDKTITKTNATCYDKPTGQIALQATGGNGNYAVKWSDGTSIFNKTNVKAGFYAYTITDTEGCLKADTVTISQPPQVFTERKDTICWGKSIQVGSYKHTQTGIYQDTLTATYNGCDSIVKTHLLVKALPIKEQNIRICYGDTLKVGLNKYAQAGLYSDTLKTAFGCDSLVKTSLEVLKLEARLVSKPQICTPNGYIEVLTQSNFQNPPPQYNWNNGQNKSKITGLSYGFYTVTVSQLGCAITLTAKVDSIANSIKVTIDKTHLTCPADSSGKIKLGITGYQSPLRILWNTNDTTSTISRLPKGKYSYAVVDSNGCTFFDTCSILSPDLFSMRVQTFDVSCFGFKDGKVEINDVKGGTSPYTYALNNRSDFKNVSRFDTLLPNLYVLQLRDAKGCLYSKNYVINEPERLKVNIEGEKTVKLGEDALLRATINSRFFAPLSIKWQSLAKLPCDSCPRIEVRHYSDFKVFLFAKDAHKCTAIDSILIKIDKTQKLFVPNVFSPNNDGVNDRFNFYGNAGLKIIKKLKIFNRWGDLIFESQDISPNNNMAGWDGTTRGTPLNPDVFVYWAEVEWWDGALSYVSGDITLVR